jgi:hypothetical protein
MILLPQSPHYWDYRYVPLYPTPLLLLEPPFSLLLTNENIVLDLEEKESMINQRIESLPIISANTENHLQFSFPP